jgi:O-succinylbenzoate synthase
VRISSVELVRIRMPLVSPFRTSFGTATEREALLVKVTTGEAEGWGECVAMTEPLYSYEDLETAAHVLRSQLVPRLLAAGEALTAARLGPAVEKVKGHPMAKAALELAVLDAELRAAGRPLGDHLGAVRDRVAAGVSVGIMDSVPELLDAVAGYLDQGYLRIKLKIEPGWDVEPVRRSASASVTSRCRSTRTPRTPSATPGSLARLDPFDLLLIEQPLAEDDLRGHAELARLIRTPVCLDESITSARSAADAIAMGACSIINVKAGRVGGYLEAVRVHDVAQAHGDPGLVRRDAGDRPRAGGQRGAGGAARLHAAGRHLGLGPLLPAGRHDALRAGGRARARPDRTGLGVRPTRTCWPR